MMFSNKSVKKKNSSLGTTMFALMPFVEYDPVLNAFQMIDDAYFDIYSIVCKNLASASESDIEYDILLYSRFYKTYSDDIKIVAMNFPTDTKSQQIYVKHKIETTTNQVYKEHLAIKLAELEYIEKHLTDREYYLIVFADSKEKFLDLKTAIMNNNALFTEITAEKKKKILYKLTNKNTSIYI